MDAFAAKTGLQASSRALRRLRLIWKHPLTRGYHHVGNFDWLTDKRYAFSYAADADQIEGFSPLIQFPDVDHAYVFDGLPAFFENRVMSKQRESYGQYLAWLGLGDAAPPIEVLARTGGGRATDTFHLVEDFSPDQGVASGRFFVSGIQHQTQGEDIARFLRPGTELQPRDEPTNPYNDRAIILDAEGKPLGWIPDWLVNDVHRLRGAGTVRVTVEQVNPDAPARLRLLCRLEATLAE